MGRDDAPRRVQFSEYNLNNDERPPSDDQDHNNNNTIICLVSVFALESKWGRSSSRMSASSKNSSD